MRWAQSGATYGNAKWHMADPNNEFEVPTYYTPLRAVRTDCGETIKKPKWLAAGRRPGLARNNVCSRCKKAYLATRPDLQGYFDRLNDKKDV